MTQWAVFYILNLENNKRGTIMDEITMYEIKMIKEKTEHTKTWALTAQEMYDFLGKIIAQGHGDAMFDVDDNEGGSYTLAKTDIRLRTDKADIYGKWIELGQ